VFTLGRLAFRSSLPIAPGMVADSLMLMTARDRRQPRCRGSAPVKNAFLPGNPDRSGRNHRAAALGGDPVPGPAVMVPPGSRASLGRFWRVASCPPGCPPRGHFGRSWVHQIATKPLISLVPGEGFEPPANGLQNREIVG
jgi:hypothetical protein